MTAVTDEVTAFAAARVLIGTTAGPVEIQRLVRETAIARRSIVSIGGTTARAGIERGYRAFVSGEGRIVEPAFGPGPYRLDLSGAIDAGSSWQLGTFVAHALVTAGRLAATGDKVPLTVWTTGTVRALDLSVGEVGYVAQKLALSLPRLQAEAARGARLLVLLPAANAQDLDADLRRQLTDLGAEIVDIDTTGRVLRLLELPPVATNIAADRRWHGSPYLSLAPFNSRHRDIFFGRGRAREEAVERLRAAAGQGTAFLLVYGRSGCGKSSLLRAGVAGDVMGIGSGEQDWRLAIVPAVEGGRSPLETLTRALVEAVPKLAGEATPDKLAIAMRGDPEQVVAWLRQALGGNDGQRSRLLLVVDQLEDLLNWRSEVVAVDTSDDADTAKRECQAYGRLVAALCRSGHCWVLASIRSDRLADLEQSPELSRLATDERLFRLERPSRGELREIVLRSAEVAGLRLDGADQSGLPLSDILVDAAAAAPDSLPLLQVVLSRMYEDEGASGRLTFTTYARLGGLEGGIARWADEVRLRLAASNVEAALLERIVLDLGRWNVESGRLAAKFAHLDKSAPKSVRQLVEALAESRLVTLDQAGEHTTIRVVHETLLTAWPWATALFESRRRDLELRDRLEQQTAAWLQRSKDLAFLLRPGLPVEEARNLVDGAGLELSADVDSFVISSIAAADEGALAERQWLEQEARDAKRRARIAWAGLAAMLVLLMVAWRQSSVSVQQTRRASIERDQGLMTQSRFLAERAAQLARDENHVTAILLSLEALPDPEQENRTLRARPIVREAVASLYWALRANRELSVLSGHKDSVSTASFVDDGQSVLTASIDKSARIWEVVARSTSTPVRARKPPQSDRLGLTDAVASPDGRWVATASQDGVVRLWNRSTNQVLDVIRHLQHVTAVRFDRTGERLAMAAQDGAVIIFAIGADGTVQEIVRPTRHAKAVTSIAFNTSGTHLATASEDNIIRIFEAASGKLLGEVSGHEDHVNSVAFSPSGDRLVSASSDRTVRIWEVSRNFQISRIITGHEALVHNAEFDGAGQRIISSSDDSTARIWDAASGEQLAVLRAHTDDVNFASFSPDGQRAVTASFDKTVRVWDASTERRIIMRGHQKPIELVDFSPDGRLLATAAQDNTARIYDADSGRQIAVLEGHTLALRMIKFNHDGRLVATASDDGTARIWQIDGREKPLVLPHKFGFRVRSVSFDGTSSRLVTASDDQTIRIWDTTTGKPLHTFTRAVPVNGAVFRPKGRTIVAVLDPDTLQEIDPVLGEEIRRIPTSSAPHRSLQRLTFSRDGEALVASFSDHTAEIWHPGHSNIPIVLRGHGSDVNGGEFDQDARLVITASNDRTARLWDVRTGIMLSVLSGHDDDVNYAIFSPDGQRIATVSNDKTVRVWRASIMRERGRNQRARLDDPRPKDIDALFDRDGTVNEAALQVLIARAKELVPRCLTGPERRRFALPEEAPKWCAALHKWPYGPESKD